MKILIISPPRCGSTSLAINLKNVLNYDEIYHEPYLYKLYNETIPSNRTFEHKYPLKISKNSIVKTITYQVSTEYGAPSNFLEFILEWKKSFDKIILLSRKNKKQHLESFVNLVIKQRESKSVYTKWNINDIKNELKYFKYDYLKPHTDAIKELSKLLDIPITYYEDLYGKNRNKSLEVIKSWKINMNFNKLNELSNPKFKLRIENKII